MATKYDLLSSILKIGDDCGLVVEIMCIPTSRWIDH